MNSLTKKPRTLTEAAQVAAAIRKELKDHGIKCRATSSNFSMGDSVSVRVYDQPPAVMAIIRGIACKYQAGRFDGMTDSYEYFKRDGITAKYVDVTNEISEGLRSAAVKYVIRKYAPLEEYERRDIVHGVIYSRYESDKSSAAFWSEYLQTLANGHQEAA